jgi:ankyrin repeat protein
MASENSRNFSSASSSIDLEDRALALVELKKLSKIKRYRFLQEYYPESSSQALSNGGSLSFFQFFALYQAGFWAISTLMGKLREDYHVSERLELTRLIIRAGVNVNQLSPEGEPLFFEAISCDDRGLLMKAFLEGGADFNRVDRHGQTILILAAQSDAKYATLKVLKESGVSLEAADPNGQTALYFAAQLGHLVSLRVLLEAGANKEVTQRDGMTPLSIAAKEGQLTAVRLLLQHGANPNCCDNHGMTPLWHAISLFQSTEHERLYRMRFMQRPKSPVKETIQIIGFLLDAGASVDHQVSGKTILQHAKDNGAPESIIARLEQASFANESSSSSSSMDQPSPLVDDAGSVCVDDESEFVPHTHRMQF